MLLLILLFIKTNSVTAYAPSPESLLRNASNADISNNVVSAHIEIVQLTPVSNTPEEKTSFTRGEIHRFYYLNEDKVQKIYNVYTDQTGGKSRHFLANGFSAYAKIQPQHQDALLFWSVLDSLLVNNGQYMITALNKMGDEIPLNQSLINQEKLALINRYREYVDLINKDKALEKSLENPFHVEELDRRQKNAEILKQPFLNETSIVNPEMSNGRMIWKVKSKLSDISFDYRGRLLLELSVLGEQNISMQFSNYVLMNGSHHFPSHFIIKKGQIEYQVKIKALKHFNETTENFDQRYQKVIKDDNAKQATVFTPFLI